MAIRGRWLLRCGAIAGPLFVATFLIDGATRKDYNPLRHPVSALSLGPRGWVQVLNFAVAGSLYLAGAAGLSRSADTRGVGRLGTAIFGATGIGLLGSALFNTDPVSGYPPEASVASLQNSRTMTMHEVAALPIFLGIPAASFAYSWRFLRRHQRGWACYSAGTGVLVLASMGIAGAGFGQAARLVNVAGLFQRVAAVTGFSWLTALAVRALR